jgi:hypothetical protein
VLRGVASGSAFVPVLLVVSTLLKVSGRSQGLDGLRQELGERFKAPRQPQPVSQPTAELAKAA